MFKKICKFFGLVYISNMHQAVQCWFGKPTWRNWQTRTVQVRVPRGMRVRLPPSVPFTIQGCQQTPGFYDLLRVWHNGCAPAFQAGYTGSTPVTRSSAILWMIKFYVAGFPSGQRGQTVNLLAMLSVVRIHLQPPFLSQLRPVKLPAADFFCRFGICAENSW